MDIASWRRTPTVGGWAWKGVREHWTIEPARGQRLLKTHFKRKMRTATRWLMFIKGSFIGSSWDPEAKQLDKQLCLYWRYVYKHAWKICFKEKSDFRRSRPLEFNSFSTDHNKSQSSSVKQRYLYLKILQPWGYWKSTINQQCSGAKIQQQSTTDQTNIRRRCRRHHHHHRHHHHYHHLHRFLVPAIWQWRRRAVI